MDAQETRTRKTESWRKVKMHHGMGQLWQSIRRQDTFRHRLGSRGALRTFRAGSVTEAREHVVRMAWASPKQAGAAPAGLTLDQLLTDWLVWREEDPDTRSGTYRIKRGHIRALRLDCANTMAIRVSDLTPHDLERAYRELRKNRAPRSVLAIHNTLMGAFTWAERRWGIEHTPKRTPPPTTKDVEDIPAIPPDDVAKILGAARERGGPIHLFVELLAGSGMRRGEALGLRWGDIDLEAGKARIERQKTETGVGPPKTKRSRRLVDLSPCCVDALRAAIGSPEVEVVGWAAMTANLRWRQLVDPLGMAWTPHQVRHSVATKMLSEGIPVTDVAAQLGDAPATVMRVYAHAIPDRHRERLTAALSW